jgi:c-di-GMP-binding flagellar brake protein YcgR
MDDQRKYQRYGLKATEDNRPQTEVKINGESAYLVDFSLGGMFLLSKSHFPACDIVNIGIDLSDSGNIDLKGKVVRVKKVGRMWGIAIDLSHTYLLSELQEV